LAEGGLARWLRWLETLHPADIELGLERVATVAATLGAQRPAQRLILVGGTNGKGSIATFAEHVLLARGVRCASYTSPHIEHFGERVRIDGCASGDAVLIAAFERVAAARGDTPLTFFEFTTLAAFELIRAAGVEVAVVEVGMGGRLDATNIVDPDVAIVGPVGVDHSEWLGSDRDQIGAEKAGIARAGRPLIVADRDPPPGLVDTAQAHGAGLVRLGADFDWAEAGTGRWDLDPGLGTSFEGLDVLAQGPGFQRDNASAAVAALHWAGHAPDRAALERGLADAPQPGRFERTRIDGVEVILDVAHNPAAAAALAGALRSVSTRVHWVLAMYLDKDRSGVAQALRGAVDRAYPAALAYPRGASGDAIRAALVDVGVECAPTSASPEAALAQAWAAAAAGERIVVAGSFAAVAAVRARGLDRASIEGSWSA
jgi:dihydrofolate synthase/folylpolyglutamate synthase